jgi:hypothetical protein
LPDPSLITHAEKIEDMKFISSWGPCGKDDFRCRSEKEARISAVNKRDSIALKEKI